MLAPLQGKLFRGFRDVIMGHKHINTLLNMFISKNTSKECVGEDGSTVTTRTSANDNDDVSMEKAQGKQAMQR